MKGLLHKIYAYTFFKDFMLIYPLAVVMFADHGMGPWQIGQLMFVWSFTALLLEIPSGVLADRISRKKLLIIGELFRAAGFACWIVWPNFFGFVLGFVLWGIESALSSGTFEALLYDELKQAKRSQHYAKIIGRCHSLSALAIFVASVGASPAILLGYEAVIWLSIVAVLLSCVSISQIPETKRIESVAERDYFKNLRLDLELALNHRSLFRVLVFLSLVAAFPGALEEFWPLFADQAGLPLYLIGAYIGLICLAEAAAGFLAHRFEHLNDRFFYLLLLFNGLILYVAAVLFNTTGLVLLIVFCFCAQIMVVVYEARLQHAIPSKTRATISSLNGFFTEAVALVIFIGFGLIANHFNYAISFATFAALMMVVAVGYLLFIRSNTGNQAE